MEFYYFGGNRQLTARVGFGREKPYLKTDYLGKPMPDSVMTGGISKTADAVLMDMAIHGKGVSEENGLKALFLYMLDESSEQVDAVGGKYFLADFSYGSFRQLSEDDCLEFYEAAEDIRAELGNVPRFPDPNQLKKRAKELSGKVKDPMQSLYHLAKSYTSKGNQAAAEESIPFYEYAISLFVTCIEVGNSDTKLQTKPEYCLSYKELGEVCQKLETRIAGKMRDYYHILGQRAMDKFVSMMR